MSEPPVSIPVERLSIEQLADLMSLAHNILSGQTPGPQDQAMRFDDWLESYRRPHPYGAGGMVATYAGCAHAARGSALGSQVICWRVNDGEDLFACALIPGDTTQYVVPRDADDVPTIQHESPRAAQPRWPTVARFVILGAKVASQITVSPSDVHEEMLAKCSELAAQLRASGGPTKVHMAGLAYDVDFVRPGAASDEQVPFQKFLEPLLAARPECLFRIGPAKLPAALNLVIPPGEPSDALNDALQALIFVTGFHQDGTDPEAARQHTREQLLSAGPAIITAMVEMPRDEDQLSFLLETSTSLGAALLWSAEEKPAPPAPSAAAAPEVAPVIQPLTSNSSRPTHATAHPRPPSPAKYFAIAAAAAALLAAVYFLLLR